MTARLVQYPGDLWNADGRTAFTLRIRAVSAGGCTVDLQGIVKMTYNTTSNLITSWEHFYGAFISLLSLGLVL